MTDDTITITVRDRDPLVVSKKMLVESSSVFSYIFVDCTQSDHEITDFSPQIVEMFLTLLEYKKVEEIEDADFRELHKISVVFKVEWLVESCRDWLTDKISNVGEVIDFESLSFLFEEVYYIYGRWNLVQFTEALILEVRFKDTSLFLSRYIRENYDHLSTDQLQFLLYLAGSNTKVFLELIIERINSQEYLDDRTRYLLQHTNLSLCIEQNDKLYHEMSGRLPEMSEMSSDDFTLVLKLIREATSEASDRKNNTSTTITVFNYCDYDKLNLLYYSCNSLSDISRLITEDKIRSTCTVIYLLVKLTYVNNTICYTDLEEIEAFVESLENLSQNNKPLQKASTKHVNMWITALEFSSEDNKHQLINLITKIRNSEKLSSSCFDNIRLVGEKITQSSSTVVNFLKNGLGRTDNRYVFRMKHPGVTDCKRKGDCGFIIRKVSGSAEYELSKKADDYTSSGVHLHEEIRAEHMYLFWVKTVTTREGDTVSVPDRWRWGWWVLLAWFSGVVTDWEITERCVDYSIVDHLVAKY